MDTHVEANVPEVVERRPPRALAVLSLGPATAVAGVVWALFQPYRVTLLDPAGEGFWRLFVEPPLLVVLVGALFHLFVARPLAGELEDHAR
jgi:hypothetical protein